MRKNVCYPLAGALVFSLVAAAQSPRDGQQQVVRTLPLASAAGGSCTAAGGGNLAAGSPRSLVVSDSFNVSRVLDNPDRFLPLLLPDISGVILPDYIECIKFCIDAFPTEGSPDRLICIEGCRYIQSVQPLGFTGGGFAKTPTIGE
jgi:hypothetical protein